MLIIIAFADNEITDNLEYKAVLKQSIDKLFLRGTTKELHRPELILGSRRKIEMLK